MKITADRQEFTAAMRRCLMSDIAAMQDARVELDDGGITITSTDLTATIRERIAADVDGNGNVSLPIQPARNLLAGMTGQTVSLTIDDDRIGITSGSTRGKIQCTGSGDLVSWPDPVVTAKITMDAAALLRMVDVTAPTASHDIGRPHLCGAALKLAGESTASMTSTDGHRLSSIRRDIHGECDHDVEAIIPNEALKAMREPLSHGGDVVLSIGPRHMTVECGSIAISAALVDQQFVRWAQLVPPLRDRWADVSRQELLAACKGVARVAARDKLASVNLVPHIDGPSLDVLASSDVEDMVTRVPVVAHGSAWSAGPVRLNLSYLTTALGLMTCDVVRLDMDGLAPAMLVDEADPDLTIILMPMRI